MLKASALSALLCLLSASIAGAKSVERIRPSQADSTVMAFDTPNLIIDNGRKDAPLVVFLPGTGGAPDNLEPLLGVVASQGYRVIGLEYDDVPAVAQICPNDPDPDCSAKFREARSFGGGAGPVQTPRQEAIESRLVALLRFLSAEHPAGGWSEYLDGDHPNWGRLILAGLSQGAGMAAYIAKRHAVQRVVLFSSPWDTTGPQRVPAPWLSKASATSPDRWWAERHARELTSGLIANAYTALHIPPDQIFVFDLPLPRGFHGAGDNPFHGATAHQLDYEPKWRILFGHP
jgi:hypothetical protein